MTTLADAVLPLIRTRADLSRWSASNAHGRQMHEAVDNLEAAIPTTDPAEMYAVTHKALASAIKVIARADDSSGIIGDACRRLLELHPQSLRQQGAGQQTGRLDDEVPVRRRGRLLRVDPVAYAPALGESGMATYRARLSDVEAGLGPRPSVEDRWTSRHSHEWFMIEWNARRLAVLDRDIDAIIRTHARDRKVAAWLEDTAEAFEEIGEIDLAIGWAKQATDFDRGHQSLKAAGYWCRLWRSIGRPSCSRLDWRCSGVGRPRAQPPRLPECGPSWPSFRDEVVATLAASPRDAVLFALLTLKEVQLAWNLAYSLGLDSDDMWERLATAYEKVDPLAVLPVLARLVDNELTKAGAQHYRIAARRLAKMRKLASGSAEAAGVDELIAELRETHRRRPRLQQEFDRAGLP